MRNIIRAAFIVIAGVLSLGAENLIIENSSFEVGRAGYDANPGVFIRNWDRFVMPAVTGETAAHGAKSLKIMNPSGMDAVQVFFPALSFKEKTHIVISFYAKASVANTPVLVALKSGWKNVFQKTMLVPTQWTRMVAEFDVAADVVKETQGGTHGMYALGFDLFSSSKPVFETVWLDGIQIEKNVLAEYAPAVRIDASIDMSDFASRQTLIYTVGEIPQADISAAVYGGGSTADAVITVTDMLNGTVVSRMRAAMQLDAKGLGSARIDLPAVERRQYRIEAVVTAGTEKAKAQRMYGGIKDLSTGLTSKRFGGSIETMEVARSWYMAPADPSYRMAAWRVHPDVYAKLAKSIGWQWIHFYGQVEMKMINDVKGVYQWDDADFCVDLYRRYGFELMALPTGQGDYHQWYFGPQWTLTGPKSLGGTSGGKDKPRMDPDAFGKFCYDAALRYKGKIDHWECWNEPGVKMREAEYLTLLKACYTNIKKANPSATVLGLTGTWDIGGDLYGWVKNCLKIGAGDFMDAIAVHGYHTKDRDYVGQVQAMAKKISGKDFRIWDSESGKTMFDDYGYPNYFRPESGSRSDHPFDHSIIFMSKHFANELANGIERQSWFNLDAYGIWLGSPQFGLINFDGSPNAAMMGQNFMIEIYDTAKIFREVPVEGNTVAYVFDRPKGPFAVYWNDALDTEGTLPLTGIRVADMMGGEIDVQTAAGGTTIKIDRRPRYIFAKGVSAEACALAVSKMTVKGLSPIKIERTILSLSGPTPVLLASVKNAGQQHQLCVASVQRKPSWIPSWPAEEEFTIPSFGSKDIAFTFPVSIPDDDNGMILSVETLKDTLFVTVPLAMIGADRTAEPITVDGQANEPVWQRRYTVGTLAAMSAAYDDKAVYFLFTVKDNEIVNFREFTGTKPLESWQTDAVELFFDLDREGDITKPIFDRDDLQLVCTVKGTSSKGEVLKGPLSFAGNKAFPAEHVAMKTTRSADGYIMEIGIPWDAFAAMGVERKSSIGFSAAIRDMDKNFQERGRAFWSGNDNNYKDTSRFGLLIFLP
ncbi:MAG: sugar-binding protein [Spirochaetota bacterium]